MENNLYNSPDIAERIKKYAKIRRVSLNDILEKCNLGSNTFSHMRHGKSLSSNSLAMIADCLECSVDYLLGRTNDPEMKSIKTKVNIEKISNEEGGTINFN